MSRFVKLMAVVPAMAFLGLAGCAQQDGTNGPAAQDKLAKFRLNSMAVSAGMNQQDIEKTFGQPDSTVETDETQLLSRLHALYVLVYNHPKEPTVKLVIGFSRERSVVDLAIWKTTEGGFTSYGKLLRPVDYWAREK